MFKWKKLPAPESQRAALHFACIHKILPLLQEYFYNDITRLRAVLGDALFEQCPLPQNLPPALAELIEDEPRWRLRHPIDQNAALNALRAIATP